MTLQWCDHAVEPIRDSILSSDHDGPTCKPKQAAERDLVRHIRVSAYERSDYCRYLAQGIFEPIMVRYNRDRAKADMSRCA